MERITPDILRSFSGTITDEIVRDEALKAIRSCFQCGTCSGSCPSGRRTAIRTRTLIREALLNMEEVLRDEAIWMCSTCYTCFERCPRSVPITNIIIKIRNLAVQRGHILGPHKQLTHILLQTGHGVPIGGPDNQWTKLRVAYGLPSLPPTTHTHPDHIQEIRTLAKSTCFDSLVGYPPESPQ